MYQQDMEAILLLKHPKFAVHMQPEIRAMNDTKSSGADWQLHQDRSESGKDIFTAQPLNSAETLKLMHRQTQAEVHTITQAELGTINRQIDRLSRIRRIRKRRTVRVSLTDTIRQGRSKDRVRKRERERNSKAHCRDLAMIFMASVQLNSS